MHPSWQKMFVFFLFVCACACIQIVLPEWFIIIMKVCWFICVLRMSKIGCVPTSEFQVEEERRPRSYCARICTSAHAQRRVIRVERIWAIAKDAHTLAHMYAFSTETPWQMHYWCTLTWINLHARIPVHREKWKHVILFWRLNTQVRTEMWKFLHPRCGFQAWCLTYLPIRMAQYGRASTRLFMYISFLYYF